MYDLCVRRISADVRKMALNFELVFYECIPAFGGCMLTIIWCMWSVICCMFSIIWWTSPVYVKVRVPIVMISLWSSKVRKEMVVISYFFAPTDFIMLYSLIRNSKLVWIILNLHLIFFSCGVILHYKTFVLNIEYFIIVYLLTLFYIKEYNVYPIGII